VQSGNDNEDPHSSILLFYGSTALTCSAPIPPADLENGITLSNSFGHEYNNLGKGMEKSGPWRLGLPWEATARNRSRSSQAALPCPPRVPAQGARPEPPARGGGWERAGRGGEPQGGLCSSLLLVAVGHLLLHAPPAQPEPVGARGLLGIPQPGRRVGARARGGGARAGSAWAGRAQGESPERERARCSPAAERLTCCGARAPRHPGPLPSGATAPRRRGHQPTPTCNTSSPRSSEAPEEPPEAWAC
jgi:hypothetical protein